MEFREVVKRRHMVRHFTPEPVAPGAIDRILDLARRAPRAGYIERGFAPFISLAPVLVIPCTSETAYHRRY